MADDDETRAHDAQGPGEHVPGVQESEADQTESQPLIGGEPENPTLAEVREHSRRKTFGIRAASAMVMIAIVAGVYWALGERGLDLIVGAVAALCFLEFIFLVIKATGNIPYRLAGILAGAAYIGLSAVILIDADMQAFYIVLGVVILADTFAYLFGTLIGGPRILPKVSPNKTWAGLLGGMFGGLLAMSPLIFLTWRQGTLDSQSLTVFAIAGPVLAVVAQSGDLFESWLKRKAGVKDSSRLIPGHGGFFDRFDGLIPVAIVVGVVYNLA